MINKPAATRPDASDNSMTEATSMPQGRTSQTLRTECFPQELVQRSFRPRLSSRRACLRRRRPNLVFLLLLPSLFIIIIVDQTITVLGMNPIGEQVSRRIRKATHLRDSLDSRILLLRKLTNSFLHNLLRTLNF